MKYEPPIRRKDTAKGHHYLDANDVRVPGVTTIIGGGLPKPALINWSANATAEAAVDQWDQLAELSPSKRIDKLKKARYEEKDRAAKRGTEVHALAEKLIQGQEIEVPEELAGHVESYVSFLDAFTPEPIHVEVGLASYKHSYAGTLDLIAFFPTLGKTLLVDIKTNRSGIFGETAWQLCAYRYADVLIDGDEQPMPPVDGCAALHIRADGYDLIPLTAGPQQFRQFLYIQQTARAVDGSRDLVGAALVPPGQAPRRRLEVAESE